MRQLLAELITALDQNRPVVYCSIVETRGSTPQKAGAAMLVYPDGSQSGTLGGGCVEAEVKQRALRVLTVGSDRPELLTFNLDDNYGWDDGLICGGRMTILADALNRCPQDAAAYYRRYVELVERGQGCTEAVVMHEQPGPAIGARYLFDGHNTVTARLAADGPPDTIFQQLTPVQQRPKASVQRGVAYLPILPRITLLIVGGGHVGQAVASLASSVDFDIWIVDDRESYASLQRFPTASRRLVGDIGGLLRDQVKKDVTPSVYTIIVTRGHAHDEEALYHLATTPAGYVGMIGSKRKIRLIFEDLRAKDVPEDALARVHAPLGFEIGSQTVPEIAISIVAELIAQRNLGDIPAPLKRSSLCCASR
jgi:xanthine dehydrogenase accessory factor